MSSVVPLEIATKILAETLVEAYERGRDVGDAERKVIEAARDWLHGKSGTFAEETALVYAVRALDALEVE